ncbi:MAG TPA: hypothetical protein DEF18_04840 [Muricauda sp.]|nr:DUF2961 domain-containing protein [uncultured Allomuricauda sp.]MAO18173.1 hypothetical protein [Allomuricauda sp.]MBC74062.1 hypothetical protein [Allomuricauda sp.]HBU77408.1 hypothetical protein [Allomuricauda sp.]|tara:strand:- start:5959 stop:8076 length:2118 start_codon:yes stop_codon:yes gene_type:complete
MNTITLILKKTAYRFKTGGMQMLMALVLFCPEVGISQHVTYEELLGRLYDQEHVATVPGPGEATATFSSFDRASRFDATQEKYVSWGANGDGDGYIRMEGDEMVVFEDDGPGVIWRFWSALAKEGHIKIYIDGQNEPIINKPFRDFFETFESDIPPMNFPELVTTLSRGRNNFIPIPYQEHCKITLTGDWGAYYHIAYSNLPHGQTVDSYSGSYKNEERIALAETDRFLSKRGYLRKKHEEGKGHRIAVSLNPGERKQLLSLGGSGAINYMEIDLGASDQPYALKNVWLDFSWDSKYHSAVKSPMGMFFGTGETLNPFRAQPVGVIGNKLYSNWYMPYGEKAELVFENHGAEPISFTLYIEEQTGVDTVNALRFHSRFISDTEENERPGIETGSKVIFDFEDLSFDGWKVEGEAFGNAPASQDGFEGQSRVEGYLGRGYVNSFRNGDAAKGALKSPKFKISKNYINLLVGGGSDENKVNVSLLVGGEVVYKASGNDIETLYWNSWDVSALKGKSAQIVINDLSSEGWGHINVDQVEQNDHNRASLDGRNLEWTFLDVNGIGRYCGVTLQIQNEWEEPNTTASSWWYGKWDKKNIDWWWGEGDEKFYVDGEKFPSTFGTGSEDYVGYAWSAEPPFPTFESAFANQPQTPIDGNGTTVVNRFHLADNVPFRTSFRATLERYKPKKWGKNEQNRSLYQATVYYYLLKE